ncbi:MAG: hypothetical protein Kow0077_20360 [Anaerolineae bacterium]
MDLYMVILRLLHIPAGILWVGFGLFMLGFAMPAALQLPDRGGQFVRMLYHRQQLGRAFPILALITTVAGILLYLRVSDMFNGAWMSSPGGIVLTIGSLAGIGAFLHGIKLGADSEAQVALLDEVAAQGGPPTPEQAQKLAEIGQKVFRSSVISSLLMIIAVIGMSTARYF